MKKLLLSISILFIAIYLISCGSQPQQVNPNASIIIPFEKEDKFFGVDLFLLIDESGSMYSGPNPTDPNNIRYEAGKYLVKSLLAKDVSPQYPHRISIIHFDQEAFPNPLIDIIPAQLDVIFRQIVFTKRRSGHTNIPSAIAVVPEILKNAPVYKNQRKAVIVLLTDGKPDKDGQLTSSKLSGYFSEIENQVKSMGDDFIFYVIGIDNKKSYDRFSDTEFRWKTIVGDKSVFSLSSVDQLYSGFNETVSQMFDSKAFAAVQVTDYKEVTFTVRPYLRKIEMHIFSKGGMELGIYNPNGEIVAPELKEAGLNFYIATIKTPQPGEWKYKILKGKGTIEIIRNDYPFHLQVVNPQPIHPLHQPIRLIASYLKDDGTQVEELKDYPLRFGALVITPTKKEFPVSLSEKKFGAYYGCDRDIPADEIGKYKIRLTVKAGALDETVREEVIEVKPLPYPMVITPEHYGVINISDVLKIQAKLLKENKPIRPLLEFQTVPNQLIVAQIFDAITKQNSSAVFMTYNEGTDIFEGKINVSFLTHKDINEPYPYFLVLQFAESPRGEDIPKMKYMHLFFMKPGAGIKTARAFTLLLEIIAGLIVLWILAVIIWISTAKKMPPTMVLGLDFQQTTKDGNSLTGLYQMTPGNKFGFISVDLFGAESKKLTGIWYRISSADEVQGIIEMRIGRGILSLILFGMINSTPVNRMMPGVIGDINITLR